MVVDGIPLLLCDYLRHNHLQDILQLLEEKDVNAHYGITLSVASLASWNLDITDKIVNDPTQFIDVLETALLSVQSLIIQEGVQSHIGNKRCEYSVKENTHARLFIPPGMMHGLLPLSPGQTVARSELVDCLVTMTGTVARTGVIKVLESRKLYECTCCGYRFAVMVDDFTNDVNLPGTCPSDASSSDQARATSCTGSTYKLCHSEKTFTNYQEILVQESVGSESDQSGSFFQYQSKGNSNSRKAVTVILQDDLADCCQIGDIIHITGIVVRHTSSTSTGAKAVVTLAVKALSVSGVTTGSHDENSARLAEYEKSFYEYWRNANVRDTIFTARDSIINSLCPMLSGMFGVKLSVLLMLIGGTSSKSSHPSATHQGEDRSKQSRSEIHLLLVGDPGTGKSQIQKFVTHMSPKSVITSGSSASAAGLTAAAVKDNGQWTLEAGALVLANGGVCCIDEIDGLKPSESSALHEAMEQQTCSVAKAGLVSTLHTRVSVFGTCNPRGNRRIDPRKSLNEQLSLSSPLLSRFDIILLLLDDMNPAADSIIVDHILKMRGHDPLCDKIDAANEQNDQLFWNLEKLKAYIQWCKSSFQPSVGHDAKQALIAYYQARRASGTDHVTVRFFESLIRLSQAHAKLVAKNKVEIDDAIIAICLADASVCVSDGGVFQIPVNLRISEMGYFMNQESAEMKMKQLKNIVASQLGLEI